MLSFDKSYRKRSCIRFDTSICDTLLTWTTHLTGVNCNRQWSWKTLAHPGLNMKFSKRTRRPLHALTRPGAMRDSTFWTQYSAAKKKADPLPTALRSQHKFQKEQKDNASTWRPDGPWCTLTRCGTLHSDRTLVPTTSLSSRPSSIFSTVFCMNMQNIVSFSTCL